MENNDTNDVSEDHACSYKGFSFNKNHLSQGNIIDGELSNSICFREALQIYSEDNNNIGHLSVSIDKEKDSRETTYVIFVSLTEYIERFKHINTLFGRVNHDFTTLEERRSDCLQLGEKKIERNVTLVNEGDEYCVSLSFFNGKDWERDSLEITKEDSMKLMGEAANYLYVRFLAQRGKCTAINFLSLLCDGSLHMCRYVSSPIGASKLGREKREVGTICVKRTLLNPRGKITAEWVLTKGAGYILEEMREITRGSVVHPMMKYCNGNDTSNEVDDITDDEWLDILSTELAPGVEGKRNITMEGDQPTTDDGRKDHLAETFGNSEAHGETEETQAMGNGKELKLGTENPTLDEDAQDNEGSWGFEGSDLSTKMILELSPNSHNEFQRKMNNRTLTEEIAEDQEESSSNENQKGRRSSQSDGAEERSSREEYGKLKPSDKLPSKAQERDEKSAETDPSDEEEIRRNSGKLSDESSQVIGHQRTGSERKMADDNGKRIKNENRQWSDMSHLDDDDEMEVEGIVVRTMEEILTDYEKVRRENTKLKRRVKKLSFEEEKLRRKLRVKDRKHHCKLLNGVRFIAIHEKSSITSDGKVDQSMIPLVFTWRDD